MTEVILISVVIALIAGVAFFVSVMKKYKSGLTSPIYPIEHYTNLDLTHREDIFLNRTVTRVRVKSSDDDRRR